MKLPEGKTRGLSTLGLTGISLMVLHSTGYIAGWAWPVLYIPLILIAIGKED